MKHQLTAILAASMLSAAMATANPCLADDLILVKNGKANCAIVIGSKSATPERNISKVLQDRICKRTGCEVPIIEEKDAERAIPEGRVAVVVGTPSGNALSRRLSGQSGRVVPSLGSVGPSGFVVHTLKRDGKAWIVLAGSDVRGTVCAVGKLFRKTDFQGADAAVAPLAVIDKIDPAKVMDLQQQKPAQWGNAFQDAPAEKIRGYIEDMAMWGSPSMLSLCNWGINCPFKEDSDARSKEKLTRVLKLLAYAGSLGMDVGYFDYPNCVYDDQVHLRKLGGKFHPAYPNDTCPSIPEVRKVLLQNRENLYRKAKQLGVEFAYIVHAPYDFGGCGCDKCKPWIATWIKLSEEMHRIAAKYHPNVKTYLLTWMCSNHEIQTIFDFIRTEKPEWVAGVVGRGFLDGSEGKMPSPYSFVGYLFILASGDGLRYGKQGSDPLPFLLPDKIKQMNSQGIRAVQTYSEGIYDDINNVIVAQTCRRPFREDIRALLEEYFHSTFGTTDEDSTALTNLIFAKFKGKALDPIRSTLHVEDPAKVLEAMNQIENRMPEWGKSGWRWGVLKTRVQLAELNARAGARAGWPKELSAIISEAAAKDDGAALLDGLGRAKTYLAELETAFQRMEKECNTLTHHLYVDLYGTPNRDPAHGSFRLRLTKRDLPSPLLRQCDVLAQHKDPKKRQEGVASLLQTLEAK